MSTIGNTTDTSTLAALARTLFDRVDADRDGRLDGNEFRGFLDSLLDKVGASPAAAQSAAPAAGPKVYQGMLGFSYAKLNDPTHTTPKYVFARATQDLDFAWDRASRSSGLPRIVDYVKAHGYPDARVVGDDRIDFGDGYGAVDVLTGDGQWWWGPPKAKA